MDKKKHECSVPKKLKTEAVAVLKALANKGYCLTESMIILKLADKEILRSDITPDVEVEVIDAIKKAVKKDFGAG